MTDLMFPKVYSVKKKKKSVNRVKKTPLAKLKREADKLAGAKCRNIGYCEECGSKEYLQWCHVISRRYHCVRWNPMNSKCFCRVCHTRFTYNPHLWTTWIMVNMPESYSLLNQVLLKSPKVDRAFMENVLKELNGN